MAAEAQVVVKEEIQLTGALSGGLTLRAPLPVVVERHADHIIVACESLNVYGYGETLDEAIDEFRAVLVDVYEGYANAPDEELTEGGQELAARLRGVVGKAPCP